MTERKRRSLYGFMEGTVTISPSVDLTEPAAPYWGLDLDTFQDSTRDAEPPRGVSPALKALWWAKKGDWDKAHRLVQDEASGDAAWVHAYLHRVEGDLGNARYWYGQAGKPPASGDLAAEWTAMVEALLAPAP